MAIITISRHMGSGGIPIAHKVAEKLGYTLVDGDAIMEVAEQYGLSRDLVEQTDEKPPHFVDRLDVKHEAALHLIELIILEYALKGNVIIYGRGGQDLLEGIKSVLRVRITAPFEDRVERWAEREWLDPDYARILVRKNDQQRAGFIKYYFDRDWNDPLGYDLVINTQRLSEESAVRLICDGIKDRNLTESKAEYKKVLADLILRKRIEIGIISDGDIEPYLLEITVGNGVATLSGQLHSDPERKRAVAIAEATAGVDKVIDKIQVLNYRSTHQEH
ncbi:MAG: BON domain-containing protein [Deltaproteobacteria bacterium]|nr:MAG: BON domain-containing protein [Deltaproteobacteria bacterium]